ncbi:uncharacterized protein LOC127866182 isoform X2 [Dreissena polymorpha]|uniref:uncharacterized protein LOC127866182 isoform X2 n=1 Tax=Dreissena polymorpha TaxID=45954 RepID=UPI00226508C3|nr:uncharacterized protein LOC127866182 isoform X2 [Dreissena polymorpha]
MQMPCKMKGPAFHCCMCVVGVFMFMGGVIMTATGITLMLNYGLLDIELLPPDLDSEEGKRTVGIILTVCGTLAVTISVITSIMYLCFKSKPSIIPDDLARLSSTRNNTPDRVDNSRKNDRSDRRSVSSISAKVSASSVGAQRNSSSAGASRGTTANNNDIYSAEVKHRGHPRSRRPRKNIHRHKNRLDQIKEDAVSRKTVDGAIVDDYEEGTYRSGSFSSEMTSEDRQKIPQIVSEDYDRPPSADSASTSHTSEASNYRYPEFDKSRREIQVMPDSLRAEYQRQVELSSRDSASLDNFDETSLNEGRNPDQCSLTSDNLRRFTQENSGSTQGQRFNTDNDHSAGGTDSYRAAQSPHSEGVQSEDSSGIFVTSQTETRGVMTSGRISPQVGEPEHFTQVEPVSASRTSLDR